jgi:hypothetical protein
VPRNLLVGSAICIAVVTVFWVVGMWPSLLGRFGVKLLAGGGLIVPAAGAVLAVLGFSGAGRLKRWAVGLAAVNVACCAAYWAFILA